MLSTYMMCTIITYIKAGKIPTPAFLAMFSHLTFQFSCY